MKSFTEYIGSQFGNPRGIIGKICCMIMNIINSHMYKNTVSSIDVKSGEKVLDIGYGNGYLLNLLYKKSKVDLYGIDISEDMKQQAEKRNKKAVSDGKLFLRVGDCCNLPYEDEFFSAVTSINTIYFWDDTIKGLTEIKRVLKKGCTFYNVVYTKEWLDKLSYTSKGFKKYELQQFMEFGKTAGFSSTEVKELIKGKSYAVMYRK